MQTALQDNIKIIINPVSDN